MSTYRILSVDGGGLRGLMTARLLQRLNAEPQIAGWLDKVDLIAGTSTGGILALALANKIPPDVIGDLYQQKGPAIFDDSIWDNVLDLGKIVGAQYSSKRLKKELKQLFGTTTLGQIRTKVAIPAFDLDNEAASPNRTWKPKIFHNFRGKDMDKDALAADVALYTSAAPTYFPSADGFVDGGVYANNPAMVALAQAISMENLAAERAQLNDIALLSIGTGVSQMFIGGKSLDWGTAQWMPQMVDLLMEGVAGIADYQARQLLGPRYQRLQIYLGEERIRLDDVRLLLRMEEIALGYVGKPNQHSYPDAVHWIEKHWMGP